MKQLKTFSDERLNHSCIYCGGPSETRDHVPPRVLLDKPFPENLPVVPCCLQCNNTKSKDEEFVACLLECVIQGSADPDAVSRPVIRSALSRHKNIQAEIKERMTTDEQGMIWTSIHTDRVQSMVKLLAVGHYWYENSEVFALDEWQVSFAAIHRLDDVSRAEFEGAPGQDTPALRPEIGSRAFKRAVHAFTNIMFGGPYRQFGDWQVVQEGRYRYLVSPSPAEVRIVISEYLACKAWICNS